MSGDRKKRGCVYRRVQKGDPTLKKNREKGAGVQKKLPARKKNWAGSKTQPLGRKKGVVREKTGVGEGDAHRKK